MTTGLAAQVAAELRKPENRNVLASVNEAAGTVTTCMLPPRPYWERERAEQNRGEVDHGRPDWSGVSESGRGLVLAFALAEQRGQDTGTDYDKLPATLSDPEVVDSWRRSEAWRKWITAPPSTRKAFVQSVLSDLKQVERR